MVYSAQSARKTWNYDGNSLSVIVYTAEFDLKQKTEIEIEFTDDDITVLSGLKGRFSDLTKTVKMWTNNRLKDDAAFQDMVGISQSGQAITYSPDLIKEEIKKFNMLYPPTVMLLEKAAKLKPEYKPYVDLLKAKTKE